MVRLISAFFAIAVLLICIGLQFIQPSLKTYGEREGSLADFIPVSIGDWKGVDVPIATSELMQKAVDQTLNFDEAIFRKYTAGRHSFFLYIAYWKPDKAQAREVATHTPDNCWVNGGWRSDVREERSFSVEKGRLQPAQYRVFKNENTTFNTLFWHVFNGKTINYGGYKPSMFSVFTDVFKKGFSVRGEQYFIRLHSEESIDALMQLPDFKLFLEKLGHLGLFATTEESEN
jgi:hypothetical protein